MTKRAKVRVKSGCRLRVTPDGRLRGPSAVHLRRCIEEGSAPFFIEFKWADYLRNKLPGMLAKCFLRTLPTFPALLFCFNTCIIYICMHA